MLQIIFFDDKIGVCRSIKLNLENLDGSKFIY